MTDKPFEDDEAERSFNETLKRPVGTQHKQQPTATKDLRFRKQLRSGRASDFAVCLYRLRGLRVTTEYRTKLANCPPQDAVAVSGTIYRGVANLPIAEEHFKSHNELGLRHCDESVCMKWGLSVWRSLEAVNNARQLHDYMRRWYIAAGELDTAEGVIVHTGNAGNPEHHTLWLEEGVSCAGRFTVIQEPMAAR